MSMKKIRTLTGSHIIFRQKYRKRAETYSTFRDNKYVVVRKGYEHPEIVMKILSVLFDYTRYEAKDAVK